MTARIHSLDIDFKIRLMKDSDYDKLSDFSCGVAQLDDFFHYEIKECVLHHYLAAYCAITEDDTIVAVFTLMNDAVMIDSHTEKDDFIDDIRLDNCDEIVDFFIKQSSYPAINIGHLGTAQAFQRRGIATAIIDLVSATFSSYDRAGCQFITVDAINTPATTKFYIENQFNFQTNRDFYDDTRRMYRII